MIIDLDLERELTVLSDTEVELAEQAVAERIRNLAEAGLTLEEVRLWCRTLPLHSKEVH